MAAQALRNRRLLNMSNYTLPNLPKTHYWYTKQVSNGIRLKLMRYGHFKDKTVASTLVAFSSNIYEIADNMKRNLVC